VVAMVGATGGAVEGGDFFLGMVGGTGEPGEGEGVGGGVGGWWIFIFDDDDDSALESTTDEQQQLHGSSHFESHYPQQEPW